VKKVIFAALFLVFSAQSYADAPVISGGWQWNSNVKIDFVYTYWGNGRTQVHFDNGEFCYILSTEKELLSTVLSMRAQNSTGQFVCKDIPDSSVDARDSRHLHRIRY